MRLLARWEQVDDKVELMRSMAYPIIISGIERVVSHGSYLTVTVRRCSS